MGQWRKRRREGGQFNLNRHIHTIWVFFSFSGLWWWVGFSSAVFTKMEREKKKGKTKKFRSGNSHVQYACGEEMCVWRRKKRNIPKTFCEFSCHFLEQKRVVVGWGGYFSADAADPRKTSLS